MKIFPVMGFESSAGGIRGSVRTAEMLMAIAIFAVLVMLGPKITSSPSFAAGMVVLAGVLLLGLVDFRLVLYLFLVFLLAYEEFDLSSTEAFMQEGSRHTVLMVTVLGVSLMDFLSILLFVPVVIREWRHAIETGRIRILRSDALVGVLLLLWAYGTVQGLFHMLTVSSWTWDMRDIVHVVMFYFIYSRTFTTRAEIRITLLLGAAVFFLKNGVFLYRFFGGGGMEFSGGYYRILIGSDLPLTAMMLVGTVASLFVYSNISRARRSLFVIATAYFTIVLLAGLGKLTYLQALAGLGLLFYLYRAEIRPRTLAAVIGIAALGVTLFVYIAIPAQSRDVIVYAITRSFGWWDAIRVYGDLSFGTRLLEIINTWDTLSREGALLFGLGWGAPWYELAAHMPFDKGAFSPEEQMSGVHVLAHIDATKFLLKIGIVGTVIFYGVFLRFGQHVLRLFRAEPDRDARWTLLILLLMLLIIVPNYTYFVRLKFLLGLTIAAIAVFRETVQPGSANAAPDPSSVPISERGT